MPGETYSVVATKAETKKPTYVILRGASIEFARKTASSMLMNGFDLEVVQEMGITLPRKTATKTATFLLPFRKSGILAS